MAQGSSTVPPVPTGPTDTLGVGPPEKNTTRDRIREVINRLSGGGTPAINAALEQHYARQKAQADLASGQLKTVAYQYAHEQDPAKREALKHLFEEAQAQYLKIVGKDKNAKGIAQKTLGVMGHIIGHQPPGGGPQGGAAGPSGAGSPQGGASAPQQQGSQTVPPPPQGAASPQPTVPPPPGSDDQFKLEAMGAPERQKMMERGDVVSDKDTEYRNKLKAEADPSLLPAHQNAFKQERDDIKAAFPDMSDADVEKAVLTKQGVTPKGTGKEMQPDFKDGMLVGVKSPATNEYYTDPKTMPPDAKAIYDSAKKVEKDHEAAQEAKENRQFQVQERLAALREKIHDREQELAQSTKIPPAEAVRTSQAQIIKEQTADLREQLKDPELQKYIGPVVGHAGFVTRRYNKKVQDFFASQESLDALLPLLHGYRGGAQTHKTFHDAMGSLTIDPKAYQGTLDALDKMSDNVINEVQEEYPNAPMFKNKRDAAATPRGKTVPAPPDGKSKKIIVSAEDMK